MDQSVQIKIVSKNMQKKIKVGVSSFEPLVISGDGRCTGFEIELWEIIANKLDLEFSYSSHNFENLLKKVKEKEIDVAIAGISRTKIREEDVSFSYFTLMSGLSILISKKSKFSLTRTIVEFLKSNYKKILRFLLIFLGFIFMVSNLFWIYEKGLTDTSINYKEGIISSAWWTVSMMGGVGGFYPESPVGRAIGFFVIFFGITFFAIFVAKIASFFTLNAISYKINNSKDLKDKKVATKKSTVAVDELLRLGAKIETYSDIKKCFAELEKGKVDAVVFDEPVIKNYVKNQKTDNLAIVGDVFDKQTYGFAFPHNSKIREAVNMELLGLFESGEYDLLYNKWFSN